MQRSGYYTLEERATRAKLMLSELKAAEARAAEQGNKGFNDKSGFVDGMVRGLCEGNRYAALIDCPLRFIEQVDPEAAQQIRDNMAAQEADQRAAEKARKEKLRPLNLTGGEVFKFVAKNSNDTLFLPASFTKMEKADGGYHMLASYLVRILSVHKDADGIDDFYRVKFFGEAKGMPTTFWTPAPNFNERRSSLRRLSPAEISTNARLN